MTRPRRHMKPECCHLRACMLPIRNCEPSPRIAVAASATSSAFCMATRSLSYLTCACACHTRAIGAHAQALLTAERGGSRRGCSAARIKAHMEGRGAVGGPRAHASTGRCRWLLARPAPAGAAGAGLARGGVEVRLARVGCGIGNSRCVPRGGQR
eukprot:3704242-Prymnesium_polylepis.2